MISLRILSLALLLSLAFNLYAENIKESYSFSLLGEPKYPVSFTHFDYVNPAAPKGGQITFATIGTFDNFNRYASRGSAAARTEDFLYDTLFVSSDDEIGSFYPLIAESARYSDDFKWMEVTINPQARFHDGTPITAEDVEFSFQKFMTEGVPQYRSYYKGAQVKALSRLTVRFELAVAKREDLLTLAAGLKILPKKFWQQHKLSEPLSIPPLSSGPYRISDYKMGKYVIYQRVTDYWAADLPVNRGRYNFNTIRYDYYLDDNISLEAFKAAAYDFRLESSPKNWATQYQGGNFDKGYVVKQDRENQSAQPTRWLSFNTQRPIFQDSRVRQAFSLAFDFEWMNKAFYYTAYQRTRSYFQNTVYAAKSYPDADELTWLLPLKGTIPPEVFTEVYQPPVTNGSGDNRQNLLKALELLQQAGWEVKNNQLLNKESKQPFIFELLLLSGGNYQYIMPFKQSLERLGISTTIREVDASQFINRLRSRDFDMIPTVYRTTSYPSGSLKIFWGSAYLNSTYNSPGVSDPAIDTLLQHIEEQQGNPKQLLALGRALDRVLTWNKFMLPLWYTNHDRFAYWNKFSMPATYPPYDLGLDTWWFDPDKASSLPEQNH